jgi:TonB-dependent SusC/RagA subfamily outer membrane receptor
MRSSLLIVAFVLSFLTSFAQKDFYSTRWSSVYKYELKNLPKSALAVVDSIYRYAKKENNITQATRALIYQSKFAVALEEDAELKIVRKFQQEIRESKPPMRNIQESLLAHIYSEYFKINRHKFYQRTRTNDKVDSLDFRTWDLTTLFYEIDAHHQRALRDVVILKQSRLARFDELLIRVDSSRRYRPTLFDLLAHHALEFYRPGESTIAKPVNGFKIDDQRYVSDFENITLPRNDTASALFRAASLYQQLLAFHKRDRDQTAYIDVELDRLEFVIQQGTFDNKTELHKQALKSLQARYRESPLSTIIDFELASLAKAEASGDETKSYNEAVDICREAIRRFPMSDGALKCKVLLESILDPYILITSEQYIPSGKPSKFRVVYENVDSIRFNVYKITHQLEKDFNRLTKDHDRIAFINSLRIFKQWSVKLKDAGDYRSHSTEVVVPAFDNGIYLVRANVADQRHESQRFLACNTFTVSDITLITTSIGSSERFQVVNRITGAPVAGAELSLHNNKAMNIKSDIIDQRIITDKNGFAVVDAKDKEWYNVDVDVTSGKDTLYHREYYIGDNRHERNEDQDKEDIEAKAFLFTDRSIYRPGQTVYYKGILVQKKGKKTSIVPGEFVEVWMEDVNGDEHDRKRVKTNSFGSFHGEFKLPSGGLTGEYSIHVEEDMESDSKFYETIDFMDEAVHEFSVEEYKRPTFELTFSPVKETYSVNDTVKVDGIAKSFSASSISKAKFKYRVRRRIVYHGYSWHRPLPSRDQEITQGEGVTDANGKFVVSFAAIPDDHADKNNEPVFNYDVSVDVIDITGETRSNSTVVKVGYHMITATINLPETISRKIKRHKVSFKTENLNGQFVPAKGTIEIFKLVSSSNVVRPRPWENPDLPLLSEDEFKKLFPNESYEDSGRRQPKKEKSIFKTTFDSNRSAEFDLNIDKTWPTGEYMIELRAIDPRGKESIKQRTFKLVDPSRLTVPNNELFIAFTDKTEYFVGETVNLTIGSASPDLTVIIDVEKDNKFVKTYIEKLSNNIRTISIPVTNIKNNGFSIYYSAVNFNSFIQGTLNLQVGSPSATLDIETQTFRDKIEPGVDERWSFTVKGKDAEQKEAELLASMYDVSLDQFRSHSWEFNPYPRHRHYGYNPSRVQEYFGPDHFHVSDLLPKSFHIPPRLYDRLDLFGFSLTKSDYIRVQYLERLYLVHDTVSTVKMKNDRSRKAGHIYGIVTDKEGTPIPGVNVLIKGTTIGTATAEDGSYMLPAGKGDQIVFSFIGYNTIEAAVERNNVINAALGEDVSKLEEVVVVGYGVQSKKSLTGSVSMISENIAPPADYELLRGRLLQGRAAGVTVTGMPGGDAMLRIRGNASLNSKDIPLYIVDGVIVDFTKIEQSDLGEIIVLKSAEATALYGSRGANGVILVTTKSGQKKIEAELAKVKARTNLNETAFFFPELRTDQNGTVSFNFKTPESLTRWKLQLFAHNRDLAYGSKTLNTVTQKDFMVSPNAPRFLRTGDQIIFPAKISNLSSRAQEGFISLQITDAITGRPLDSEFKNQMKNQSFKVDPKSNKEVMWRLRVPDDVQAVQYRIVASSGKFSDGEQNILPVLQNRMLVTETLPMSVRSGETKTFTLDKLKSNTSTTLKHHQVTMEVTSNPVWYAIQSLPYLIEYPHECAEQMFSRYYGNTLASFLLNSNPKLKQVFDQWSSSGQLISALEKNPELKSLIIQETPWLRDAQSESEQKKRMAALFDLNLMREQQTTALNKLEGMQMGDGGFPWFNGAREASYHITQHVASGYGHLRKLKALPPDDKNDMIERAVKYLDNHIIEYYDKMIRHLNYRVGYFEIQYLYMRSFYPEIARSEKLESVIAYYMSQTEQNWDDFSLYQKGMLALVQQRAGKHEVARSIMASVKENSVISEELGMYWKNNVAGWGWYEAPVETHALMIEAFAEVEAEDKTLTDAQRRKTLDELRIWLLKNKQTTQWKTTKATTEAVYALLLNGTDWLPEKTVEVFVGDKKIVVDESSPEAGTGYFKKSWKGKDVDQSLGDVKLVKKDEGIAWAGLYWQYFEDLDKITHANTPLKLSKKLFIVRNTATGEVLEPIAPVKVGDLVRVRIELKVDRDMEFLHMKDMRGSGLEPINVLSSYKWRDNLGYYESTKDASTNFFFDAIRTGVYVFEYDLRATIRGDFSNGITSIESMYAPEFRAHSEGIRVIIE